MIRETGGSQVQFSIHEPFEANDDRHPQGFFVPPTTSAWRKCEENFDRRALWSKLIGMFRGKINDFVSKALVREVTDRGGTEHWPR